MKRLWARLVCFVWFHKLVIVHSCSRESHKLKCVRCGRFFGIHYGMRVFLDWSDDLCVCAEMEEFFRNETA